MSAVAITWACRGCGEETAVVRRIERAPGAVQTLLPAEHADADPGERLTVCRCIACGLVQAAEERDADRLYSPDYLYSVAFSAHAQAYQRGLAERWVRDHGLAGKRILEVGGGDGYFATLLGAAGCHVTLLDPAGRACAVARERGVPRVIEGLFPHPALDGERYDAIVARHVLEHVPEPVEFLGALGAQLVPGGTLLVEVPNLDGIVAAGRLQDFYAEHLLYLDPATLTGLVTRAGLRVEELHTLEGGDYLALAARPAPRTLDAVVRHEAGFVAGVRGLIAEARAHGRRVAVWGAGGRCVSLLALLDADDLGLAYVLDGDPQKRGLVMPVTRLPVVSPDALHEDPVDDVVVLATAFQDEIVDGLAAFRAAGGRVGVLHPEIGWLS